MTDGMDMTREGVIVKPGQKWRDLDKRMRGRTLVVLEVKNGRAFMNGPRKTSLAISRMHKHSTGWELIP